MRHTLQVMAPTSVKMVHQISLLHIESNPDPHGLLSPTHGQRSQQQSGKITLQSVLINKPKFLKATVGCFFLLCAYICTFKEKSERI